MSALAHLDHRAVIRVEGPEARPFLNRLLTQEVETLEAGDLRYGALLTPQGRLLHDLFLWGEDDGVALDVDAGSRAAITLRLNAYKLRAAVRITTPDDRVFALWDADAPPAGWRRDPRASEAGWRLIAAEAHEATAPAAAYRTHRAGLGLTDAAQDGLSDKAYATEANLDLAHGVDFSKGCFVGQETTSRMKRRGGIRSRVLPLEAPDAAPGDAVEAGARRAGEVVAAGSPALALVRLDRALAPGGALTVNAAPVRIAMPERWRELVLPPAVETVA